MTLKTSKPDNCPHCDADIRRVYWITPRDDLAESGIHNRYTCHNPKCIKHAEERAGS